MITLEEYIKECQTLLEKENWVNKENCYDFINVVSSVAIQVPVSPEELIEVLKWLDRSFISPESSLRIIISALKTTRLSEQNNYGAVIEFDRLLSK